MNRPNTLLVKYNGTPVGRIALTRGGLTALEYDAWWIEKGFSISPISLPLQKGVFLPKHWEPFEGTFGVFADSLPDGWGRLLVDRMLVKNGESPQCINVMQRLAIVGSTGMGALTYEPEVSFDSASGVDDLDMLSEACKKLLLCEYSDDLDTLFKMGGSSGGARPKIFTEIGGESWIVKFPSSFDGPKAGKREYLYSLCARKCGIEMAETKLLPSKVTSGYFGTKRFDRVNHEEGARKVHVISAAGLLETSHRTPNLDYIMLMKLTVGLTKDFLEAEKLFRLMCFNVFAHNRDDHSKNFSFIYDEDKKVWRLSPAYDLTYSDSIGGEHATSVAGEGRSPGIEDILKVAASIGLDMKKAGRTANEIKEKTNDLLGTGAIS